MCDTASEFGIMPSVPHVPLVAVCGPIASGKSTVIESLAGALQFRAWPERVQDNPFFERYCANPTQWALRSQLAFMLGAVEDAVAARRHPPGGVIERPVQEMFGVFVEDMSARGVLAADERNVLRRVARLGEALAGPPDVLVVLDADPEELLTRVQVRARPGEEAYDLAFFDSLEGTYADWASRWNQSPVIHVDAAHRDLRLADEVTALAGEVTRALTGP
jgi:deoxyadenosine/deoxycytidine kinase